MAGYTFKTPDGFTYKYANSTALLTFVREEIAAWEWLARYGSTPPAQWVTDATLSPLRNAEHFLGQQPLTDEIAEMGRAQVNAYFDSKLHLHPKAILRTIINKIAPQSPAEAIYMIAAIGHPI